MWRRRLPWGGLHRPGLALSLIALGVLLLSLPLAYAVYGWRARARLPQLEATAPLVPLSAPLPTQPPAPTPTPRATAVATPTPAPSPRSSVYPADLVDPRDWLSPRWARADTDNTGGVDPGRFRPVDWRDAPPPGTLPRATRLRIPILGIDAAVEELRILDLGDSRQYETPAFVVGHIPETANPGEAGNAWYFGHLESPLRNEGNVFRQLLRVPDLLRQGYRVYVLLDTPSATYLYQVVSTKGVHESQLVITGSDVPTVTLVTCYPLLIYDHRLVVTAQLVGVRP